MKITIDQAEIEQAIKAYISNQITVKDGQEITIDMKAGRGENGFSAEINISTPAAAPAVPAGIVKRAAPVTPAKASVIEQEAAVEPTKPEQVETPIEQESAPVEASVAEPETEQETAGTSENADASAPAEVPAAAAPSTSLFASLKRPVNN